MPALSMRSRRDSSSVTCMRCSLIDCPTEKLCGVFPNQASTCEHSPHMLLVPDRPNRILSKHGDQPFVECEQDAVVVGSKSGRVSGFPSDGSPEIKCSVATLYSTNGLDEVRAARTDGFDLHNGLDVTARLKVRDPREA